MAIGEIDPAALAAALGARDETTLDAIIHGWESDFAGRFAFGREGALAGEQHLKGAMVPAALEQGQGDEANGVDPDPALQVPETDLAELSGRALEMLGLRAAIGFDMDNGQRLLVDAFDGARGVTAILTGTAKQDEPRRRSRTADLGAAAGYVERMTDVMRGSGRFGSSAVPMQRFAAATATFWFWEERGDLGISGAREAELRALIPDSILEGLQELPRRRDLDQRIAAGQEEAVANLVGRTQPTIERALTMLTDDTASGIRGQLGRLTRTQGRRDTVLDLLPSQDVARLYQGQVLIAVGGHGTMGLSTKELEQRTDLMRAMAKHVQRDMDADGRPMTVRATEIMSAGASGQMSAHEMSMLEQHAECTLDDFRGILDVLAQAGVDPAAVQQLHVELESLTGAKVLAAAFVASGINAWAATIPGVEEMVQRDTYRKGGLKDDRLMAAGYARLQLGSLLRGMARELPELSLGSRRLLESLAEVELTVARGHAERARKISATRLGDRYDPQQDSAQQLCNAVQFQINAITQTMSRN